MFLALIWSLQLVELCHLWIEKKMGSSWGFSLKHPLWHVALYATELRKRSKQILDSGENGQLETPDVPEKAAMPLPPLPPHPDPF